MRVWLLCESKKFCNNIFAIIVLCPQKYYLINTMCLRWQLRWMRQSLRHFYLSKKENVNMRGGMQKGPYKFKGPQNLKLPLSFLMWLSLTTKLTFELYRYCVFHMLNKDFSKLMWTYVFLCHAGSHFELFRLHHHHCHHSYYSLCIFKTEMHMYLMYQHV